MASKFKFHWSKVLLFVSFLSPFVIFFLIIRGIPEESIRHFIQSTGRAGPAVYILAMFSTFIFAPLSGSPILFAGFYAFRSMVVWYTLAAAILASITNFWIARFWGRGIVQRLVGRDSMQKVDKAARDYGILMLVLLRLFQGGIHEFVSYAAGLTSMRFSTYFLVSTVSSIPSSIFWYYLSLTTESVIGFATLNFSLTIIFAGVFAIAVFLVRLLKRK